MGEIREDLARLAAAELRRPGAGEGAPGPARYLVFGHSMGAVNGYVMAGRLAAMGLGYPARFIASSYSVPGWHPIPPGMADLPDLEMWLESAMRFGILNRRPVPDRAQMAAHSRVYRADLRAVEGYRPGDPAGLPCPVTAVYAEDDMVDEGLVRRWQGLTPYPLEVVRVPGGHFHPLEHPGTIEEIILGRL
jgi:surfactin synthase thioesterase subunit